MAFDPSTDDDDDDDDHDWESRLKRRRQLGRMDPDRRLRSAALTELANNGYEDLSPGQPLKFVHAADVVSLRLGDARLFPGASDEDIAVELQYPGSLTRERFVGCLFPRQGECETDSRGQF